MFALLQVLSHLYPLEPSQRRRPERPGESPIGSEELKSGGSVGLFLDVLLGGPAATCEEVVPLARPRCEQENVAVCFW